jgi:hypothetical protein
MSTTPGAAFPPPVAPYPARLNIEYPEKLDQLSTAFRVILVIPIAVILSILTSSSTNTVQTQTGEWVQTTSGGVASALFLATLLMILFRQRYPRWWFDFGVELARFSTRVGAYLVLLTDKYPSTVEHQGISLEIDYPDVERDLKRWMPLVKWFLAIPHMFVLFFLAIAAIFSVIIAWFAILFTGNYPRGLFNFVLGVGRWALRVYAYAFLLVTDRYPPFSLK